MGGMSRAHWQTALGSGYLQRKKPRERTQLNDFKRVRSKVTTLILMLLAVKKPNLKSV